MGQGPPRFIGCGVRIVCGFEFQPGTLGILLQQAQPYQATACTLANQVNQILQLTFIWCPDAPEPAGAAQVPVGRWIELLDQGDACRQA